MREPQHFGEMLKEMRQAYGKNQDESYPVRVVFCLSPKAYWQWICGEELTEGRDLVQLYLLMVIMI